MRNRHSLFQRNRTNKSVKNDGDVTEIFLYDEIGYWGIQASEFCKELRQVESSEIKLRINSPGGSVFEGVAMMTAISEHPANIVAHIDGLAASMASGIAMVANEIVIAKGAFMMIHEPWSMVAGDAEMMRDEAELLDNIGSTLADNYAERTGREDIRDLMKAETWMNHDEAVEMGFADSVLGESGTSNKFDLSVYKNVPKLLQVAKTPSDTDIEKALREAGLSRKGARDFVHDARKSQRQADDNSSGDAGWLEEWKNEINQYLT